MDVSQSLYRIATPCSVPVDCKLEYDPTTWVAFYDVTIPVCGWYAYYADFLKNVVVVLADAIIDIVTLLKVQKMRRQFRDGKRADNYTKKETDFLKQVPKQIR